MGVWSMVLYEQKWFQLEWDTEAQALHIAAKELIPIVVAQQWSGTIGGEDAE